MVLEAFKNALKLAMASIALLILSNHFTSNLAFMILGISFIVCGVAFGAINTIEKRPKPSQIGPNGELPSSNYGEGDEAPTEQQTLIEGFLNKIMEFCHEQGENCTLMNQTDGLWVVRVNDSTGQFDKILNLSIPSENDVTKENIESITNRTLEELSVNLKQHKD